MCRDEDHWLTSSKHIQHRAAMFLWNASAKEFDTKAEWLEEVSEDDELLPSQELSWGEEDPLQAASEHCQEPDRRYHRLPTADIALDEAHHPGCLAERLQNIIDDIHLAAGKVKGQRVHKGIKCWPVYVYDRCGFVSEEHSPGLEDAVKDEQFFIGETAASGLVMPLRRWNVHVLYRRHEMWQLVFCSKRPWQEVCQCWGVRCQGCFRPFPKISLRKTIGEAINRHKPKVWRVGPIHCRKNINIRILQRDFSVSALHFAKECDAHPDDTCLLRG
jgi:hypothetical protein